MSVLSRRPSSADLRRRRAVLISLAAISVILGIFFLISLGQMLEQGRIARMKRNTLQGMQAEVLHEYYKREAVSNGVLLTMLAGFTAAAAVLCSRLNRQRNSGMPRCRRCGYCLVGLGKTPQDARCPECGQPFDAGEVQDLEEQWRALKKERDTNNSETQ